MPAALRPETRYLTLYALPADRRRAATQVVGYALNALSRSRIIKRPVSVSPTLLRITIAAYTPRQVEYEAWRRAWEKLVEDDPYFHLRTEVVDRESPKKHTVTVEGGWIDLGVAGAIRQHTQSLGAVLRADFFVATALATPHYYDFADVPNKEADFILSLGIDQAAIRRLHADAGANLIISHVTGKPRRVAWAQGPLGGFYQTFDVERVDAERDPLRRPVDTDEVKFKFDASEIFAIQANGLWRVALFSAAGQQQQSVPDRIAKDSSEPRGDGIVTPLVGCIRCHREAGLRPFEDDQSKLLAGGRVDLFSPKREVVERAAEFYDQPRLMRQMEFDRQTYAAAVRAATAGLTPEQLSDALARVVREYSYTSISVDQAAREVGMPAQRMAFALRKTSDPILLTIVEGRAVHRGQWESSFQEAALAARADKETHPQVQE